MNLYIQCFLIACLGWALQTVIKLQGLKTKSIQANIQFSIGEYFKQDWLSFLATFLTIGIFMFIIDNILNWSTWMIDYIKVGFAFVGYTGASIASTLFSAMSKKINHIIDQKTSIADRTTGTTDIPTELPKNKDIVA